jgi:hypothetical protein
MARSPSSSSELTGTLCGQSTSARRSRSTAPATPTHDVLSPTNGTSVTAAAGIKGAADSLRTRGPLSAAQGPRCAPGPTVWQTRHGSPSCARACARLPPCRGQRSARAPGDAQGMVRARTAVRSATDLICGRHVHLLQQTQQHVVGARWRGGHLDEPLPHHVGRRDARVRVVVRDEVAKLVHQLAAHELHGRQPRESAQQLVLRGAHAAPQHHGRGVPEGPCARDLRLGVSAQHAAANSLAREATLRRSASQRGAPCALTCALLSR